MSFIVCRESAAVIALGLNSYEGVFSTQIVAAFERGQECPQLRYYKCTRTYVTSDTPSCSYTDDC